tara:strand:+ start:77 stop:823 length:747 start_codon:yes stop_codon:yes gene_type:complete
MTTKSKLLYEGKAKKILSHEDVEKVIIEFKDDATAFNAHKKAKFTGKGELNCSITSNIFEILKKNQIPTHFLERLGLQSIVAQKIDIIPIEIVLRNIAYGSLCKQTNIKSGTVLKEPLIDYYLKNDSLNDPLLTLERIKILNIISEKEINLVNNLTLSINKILKEFFFKIELELVDFKLEFGRNLKGEIILGDEFSPDNCRLWDLKSNNVKIKSLDKDLFRNDLGDLIEAYSEINNRINNFMRFNQEL